MPVYEYYCPKCSDRFELLRPLSRMDDPASCPAGHEGGERVLSRFAAMTKGGSGEMSAVAGGGCGCGNCGGGSCGSCSVN